MRDLHLPYELLSLLVIGDVTLAVAGSLLIAFVVGRVARFPWWLALVAALIPVLGPIVLVLVAAVMGRLKTAGRRPHRGWSGWLAAVLVGLGLLAVIAGCFLPLLRWHGELNEAGYRLGQQGTVSLLEYPVPASILVAIIVLALGLTIGLFVRGGSRFAVPLLVVGCGGLLASVTTLLLALAISDLADSLQRLTLERAWVGVDAGSGAWVLIAGWVLLSAGATMHCLRASTTHVGQPYEAALAMAPMLPSLPPASGSVDFENLDPFGQRDPFRQEDGF